jgi:hypothetical protein
MSRRSAHKRLGGWRIEGMIGGVTADWYDSSRIP